LKYNGQTWFLDYLATNSQVSYLGKWEKQDYLTYQKYLDNKLDEYQYQNGYKEQVTAGKSPIRFWYKGDSINTIFEGSFFKGDSLAANICQVQDHHKNIERKIFQNNKIKYSDKVQRAISKVYRVDVSTNLNCNDLDDVQIKGKSRKLRKYYEDADTSKVTGIQYGNRGRENVHFRCYMKDYDKNKYHDYMRFGKASFTRIEYELGTRPIKNYGIRYLDELTIKPMRQSQDGWVKDYNPVFGKTHCKTVTNWESLLNRVHRTANYIIPNRPIFKPFEMNVLPNKKYEPDRKYYYKEQVDGIIFNHFTREEMNQLSNKLDWRDLNYEF
jgi:hypothetical protein